MGLDAPRGEAHGNTCVPTLPEADKMGSRPAPDALSGYGTDDHAQCTKQ